MTPRLSRDGERGSVVLEWTGSVLLLVILLWVVVDSVGLAMARHTLTVAAREGARAVSVSRTIDAGILRANEVAAERGVSATVAVEQCAERHVVNRSCAGNWTLATSTSPVLRGGIVRLQVTSQFDLPGTRVVKWTGTHAEYVPTHGGD